MNHARIDIAVLVSGRGSNLRAIASAIDAGRCSARIVGVVADRPGTAALEFAASLGVPTRVVDAKAFADRAAWDNFLALELSALHPQLVVLAGFMRIIGTAVLGAFGGSIVNVHPALLPSFPGMDGPAQAIAARVALAGCTVHVVDTGVDTGPILAQAAVPVLPNDDAQRLHTRIQAAEHALLPQVIDAIARGHLALQPEPKWQVVGDAPAALLWPASGT
jgi:phosphoribosylglycinamide formyltransferase-1